MKKYIDILLVGLLITISTLAQTPGTTIIAADYTISGNTPDSTVATSHEAVHLISSENDAVTSGKIKFGIASFYSRSLEGSETATGETFHHANMTAASNFFKLNTWVKVTNLNNGRSIIVRINDRMAERMAKKGRVVDLTKTGASKLNFVNSGIVKVKVEEISGYSSN